MRGISPLTEVRAVADGAFLIKDEEQGFYGTAQNMSRSYRGWAKRDRLTSPREQTGCSISAGE